MAVSAITTSIGAPISPAVTVVSPIMIPPIIDTAWPIALGSLSPASLIISYKTRSETIKELPALSDIVKKDTNKEYQDKVLFEGEYYRLTYPRGGYVAKAYLQTYKDGKFIEEKEIRNETYQPQHGVIIEGAEKAPENLKTIEDTVTSAESYTHSININNENYTIPSNICP